MRVNLATVQLCREYSKYLSGTDVWRPYQAVLRRTICAAHALTPVLYKRKPADFSTFLCTHNPKKWKSKKVSRFSRLKLLFQK
jgi:hypothetical protein